jgi:copper homeostasis protein
MMLLEVIATSAEDCATAQAAGADRIELCCALALGGLTPSAALVQRARAATTLPLMMMLRPREGGFCYSAGEFTQMALDLKFGLAVGVDGFVFGCLTRDGAVDARRTAHLVKLAAGRQTVFHRAFDVTPDPAAALEALIDLGVTRVLTSGQAATALAGADLIRQLVVQADGRIELLPGSGITPDNVAELVRRTGVQQVHASCSGWASDTSTQARPLLRFDAVDAPGDRVRVLDGACIATLRAAL